jgi:AAA ATPase domain
MEGVSKLTSYTESDLKAFLNDPAAARQVLGKIEDLSARFASAVLSHFSKNIKATLLIKRLMKESTSLAVVDEIYLRDRPLGWIQEDLFQQSFSELFLTYFEKHRNNEYLCLLQSEGRACDKPRALTEAEFVARHGKPPWELVNSILSQAKLHFKIDYPKDPETHRFRARLTKELSDTVIELSSLSSGEKILMSFVFCLYHTGDPRQFFDQPKVLLFDEIDAPLHPSMSRVLVETIERVLVREYGIKVIMATHSPSTIAVAPDESIHVLEFVPGDAGHDTRHVIRHEAKRRAIASLTAEIPTLSISFDGRRQVFVESAADAEKYELLYRKLSSHIESERSLVFIGVGSDGGAHSAGCDQVKQVVEALADGGNNSVLGLVDWDAKREPTPRVRVLAKGTRYAIENCLLDPLLVGAALLHENIEPARITISSDVNYKNLSGSNRGVLQAMSDAIVTGVLKKKGGSGGGDAVVEKYKGGHEIEIEKAYLMMNGHELEKRLQESYDEFKKFHNSGALLRFIISPILAENVDLVPCSLFDSMRELCEMSID